MNKIYFDHNATTMMLPEAFEAMVELAHLPLNASSIHAFGRNSRNIIEHVRGLIIKSINANSMGLIFTASGSESNNMVVHNFAGEEIFVSAVEHPSILKTAKNAKLIPVDENGIVKLAELEKMLITCQDKGQILISVMLANNETGIIQPIKDIVALAHKHNALVHTDAVQVLGRIQLNIDDLNVDMVTISSHKSGGPHGAAALLYKKNLPLKSFIIGGGQEKGYRAGTENVMAIAGFGVAIEKISITNDVKILRNFLEQKISAIAPDSKIFGKDVQRLPNTSCITMPNVSNETQVIDFDIAGFAISSGSACSSGRVTISHVLTAMGVPEKDAKSAIRISLGRSNNMDEVEKFVQVWEKLYKRVGVK